ncbi:unnamed protein product [Amoebophrya sp. A120]|nr:unnamed protein product [Amoebophrya sp. A120]|eukprot:GSA120T00024864001.1
MLSRCDEGHHSSSEIKTGGASSKESTAAGSEKTTVSKESVLKQMEVETGVVPDIFGAASCPQEVETPLYFLPSPAVDSPQTVFAKTPDELFCPSPTASATELVLLGGVLHGWPVVIGGPASQDLGPVRLLECTETTEELVLPSANHTQEKRAAKRVSFDLVPEVREFFPRPEEHFTPAERAGAKVSRSGRSELGDMGVSPGWSGYHRGHDDFCDHWWTTHFCGDQNHYHHHCSHRDWQKRHAGQNHFQHQYSHHYWQKRHAGQHYYHHQYSYSHCDFWQKRHAGHNY